MYLGILEQCGWPNPFQSSASQKGGAPGFNTETGPGPAPPPVESLRRMLPEDRIWPINSWWDYHAAGGPFRDLKVFTAALSARYGPAAAVEVEGWNVKPSLAPSQ